MTSAGPAPSWWPPPAAAEPMTAKIPAPTIAPMPSAISWIGPSVRFIWCCGSSASARIRSSDLVRKSWLFMRKCGGEYQKPGAARPSVSPDPGRSRSATSTRPRTPASAEAEALPQPRRRVRELDAMRPGRQPHAAKSRVRAQHGRGRRRRPSRASPPPSCRRERGLPGAGRVASSATRPGTRAGPGAPRPPRPSSADRARAAPPPRAPRSAADRRAADSVAAHGVLRRDDHGLRNQDRARQALRRLRSRGSAPRLAEACAGRGALTSTAPTPPSAAARGPGTRKRSVVRLSVGPSPDTDSSPQRMPLRPAQRLEIAEHHEQVVAAVVDRVEQVRDREIPARKTHGVGAEPPAQLCRRLRLDAPCPGRRGRRRAPRVDGQVGRRAARGTRRPTRPPSSSARGGTRARGPSPHGDRERPRQQVPHRNAEPGHRREPRDQPVRPAFPEREGETDHAADGERREERAREAAMPAGKRARAPPRRAAARARPRTRPAPARRASRRPAETPGPGRGPAAAPAGPVPRARARRLARSRDRSSGRERARARRSGARARPRARGPRRRAPGARTSARRPRRPPRATAPPRAAHGDAPPGSRGPRRRPRSGSRRAAGPARCARCRAGWPAGTPSRRRRSATSRSGSCAPRASTRRRRRAPPRDPRRGPRSRRYASSPASQKWKSVKASFRRCTGAPVSSSGTVGG